MTTLFLHDSTPAQAGERHGSRGPTHAATIRDLEYEYQIEEWLMVVHRDHSHIVVVDASDGRRWRRAADRFEPEPGPVLEAVTDFDADCPRCHRRVRFARAGGPDLSWSDVQSLLYATNLKHANPELYKRLAAVRCRFHVT